MKSSIKDIKNSKYPNKLMYNNNNSQPKLALFLRSQDYFLFNLLNRKEGMQKGKYPKNVKINLFNNNHALPSIKIKRIINIGKNGFYSFKKVDCDYNSKRRNRLNEFNKNNINYIIQNYKKSLTRYNSARIIRQNKNKKIFDKNPFKERISSPLIITHINTLKMENNKLNKYKRNFSNKSIQKEEIKIENNYIYNNKNVHYMTIYKKNEGTQMNYHNNNYKDNNIFFSEKKKPQNKVKIDYCSPKSIIFHKIK